MINQLSNYIKGSMEELRKVTWPTKNEVKNYTILIIGICLAFVIFFGVADFGFTWIFEKIVTK